MGSSFEVGRLRCALIVDGHGSLPAAFAFASAPAEELEAALEGASGIDAPYQCLLVRSPEAVVVIDAGLGSYEHPLGGTGGGLEAGLEAEGVALDDVDVLVLTHTHLDHIGGLCVGSRPRFARARHVISRAEWELSTSEPFLEQLPPAAAAVAREQLPPLEQSGLLALAEGIIEAAPGIRLLPAPGHTPGHLVVELDGGGAGALYLGDVISHPLHAQHPDWVMAVEIDQTVVTETRRSLLGRAADEQLLIAAAHIAIPAHVERSHDGFRLQPAGS